MLGHFTRRRPIRTKLFISYATEDSQFALWLYRKLTIYGYDVWMDHASLRKGSSFPAEFPKAIREETIKFLALMSPSSQEKDNPSKERFIASETKKKLGDEYFIIPLKISKEPATDFITCNLNWIDFTPYWANGLADLIKELEASNVPKSSKGLDIVSLASGEEKFNLPHRSEDVFTNLISIDELPHSVYQVPLMHSSRQITGSLLGDYIYTLEVTPEVEPYAKLVEVSDLILQNPLFVNTFKSVIQKFINLSLVRRGLTQTMDRKFYAFPITKDNKISYLSLSGRKTWIKTKGTAKTATYITTVSYTFELDRYGKPKIVVSFKFNFTNAHGMPYSPKLAFKKQMNLRKNLWNEGWLKKILALTSFLAEGNEQSELVSSLCGKIAIKGRPDQMICYHGITDQSVDLDSDVSDDLAEVAITEEESSEQHHYS